MTTPKKHQEVNWKTVVADGGCWSEQLRHEENSAKNEREHEIGIQERLLLRQRLLYISRPVV